MNSFNKNIIKIIKFFINFKKLNFQNMNITDKVLEDLIANYKEKDEINILNFQSMTINKINMNQYRLENIEYLCLKNNQIRDIGFISTFPNLWYFDIRGNYVNIKILNLD